MFQFNIVFGILVAFFSNYLIGTLIADSTAWRWMLGVEADAGALLGGTSWLVLICIIAFIAAHAIGQETILSSIVFFLACIIHEKIEKQTNCQYKSTMSLFE
jgi:LytS/YehU family sensor histidine kinase